MKKKGFTLIELLAVIIILAVIALIATPVVLNIVENAKKEADKASANGIVDAAKLYYAEMYLDGKGSVSNYECTFSEGSGCTELTLTGTLPKSGTITIDNKGMVNGKLSFEKNIFYICNSNVKETLDSTCSFTDYENIYAINNEGVITGFKTKEETSYIELIPVVSAAELTDEASAHLSTKEITIPEYVGSIEVSGIASNAFSSYDITKITILSNKGITIGENALPINLEKLVVKSCFTNAYDTYSEILETIETDCKLYDSEAPVFQPMQDITVGIGETVDLTNGVVVTDNVGLEGTYTYSPESIDTSVVGETIVTYKAIDKAGNETTVTRKVTVRTLVTDIILSESNVSLEPGETVTVTAEIIPSGATNKDLEWTSSNESIAKVENGKITGINIGDAKVTVKSLDGTNIIKTINVTVEDSLVGATYKFDYTGSSQTFMVPKTGRYKIELWGAGVYADSSTWIYGSYTSGTISLSENSDLYIYVGGQGLEKATSSTFNGGGGSTTGTYGTYVDNYPGGGATDVRLVSGDWNNTTSLNSRIMVAAGSGRGSSGGGITSNGSVPGNQVNSNWSTHYVTGASQTAGGYNTYDNSLKGTFGIGSNGESYSYGYGSSGGGGGYYGGGGSISNDWFESGDRYSSGLSTGGSSYISGHTGCVAITSETSQTPKSGCTTGTTNNSCSIHYSNYKFTDTVMIDGNIYSWTNVKGEKVQMPSIDGSLYTSGGKSGNGYAKITYLGK